MRGGVLFREELIECPYWRHERKRRARLVTDIGPAVRNFARLQNGAPGGRALPFEIEPLFLASACVGDFHGLLFLAATGLVPLEHHMIFVGHL